MNLVGLQRFLATAQLGSLNKAAEQLHITQPALTRSIQLLEERLGVPLFVRGARGVTLTAFGRAVHFRARLIDAEVGRLFDDVAALRERQGGKVHVGAPPGPGFHTGILPAATRRLVAGARRVSVQISMGTREQLLPVLRQGVLDFVIGVIEHDESSDDLLQEPLFEDRNVVVVGQSHPLRRRRRVALAELLRHPWYVMSESAALERALLVQARADGRALEHALVQSDSSQLVKSAVVEGDCVGFMRLLACRQDIRDGLLCELALEPTGSPAPGRYTMGLIGRRGAELSPAAQELMAEIRAACTTQA